MTCVALSLGGVFGLARLPLGLAPSAEFPALSISTSWAGVSAEGMEQTITVPIEEIVSSMRGVRKVRSASREGHSRVSVEFDPRTNMNLARLELNEQLSLFAQQLPRRAGRPVIERYVPADIERLQGFLSYSLAGHLSRAALAKVARQKIIPGILSVKGVAQVMLEGEEEEELQVELSPDKLSAAGISPGEVVAALERALPEKRQASLRGPAGVEAVRFAGKEASLRELEDTPVRREGSPVFVRLRDLGKAGIAHAAPRQFLRVNGEQCLTLTIVRDPASNLSGTARDVRSCLARLAGDLPPGVEIACESDQSRRWEEELHLLYRDGLFALLMVWLVLSFFLGGNRAPIVLISSVLLSLAGTFLVLWILQIPVHLLTLAGLALGIGRLLDDSIVVLENLHRWTERRAQVPSIIEGACEVTMPVISSTLAMAAAMAPVLFLPKELQIYLREFSIAVTVSLFMSLLVAFTVIPAAATRWKLTGRWRPLQTGGYTAAAYRRLLRHTLNHKLIVVAVALWMFGIPVWLLPPRIETTSLMATLYNATIGGSWYAALRPVINAVLGGASYQFFQNVPRTEFFDPGSETFLLMQVQCPQGSDLFELDSVARVLEQDLLRAGAPRLTTRVIEGAISLRVDFPDSAVGTSLPLRLRSHCFRLAAQMGGAAVSVAGFGAGFSGGTEMQPAFTVCVLGYSYLRVKRIAELLCERLRENPRVTSADIDRAFGNWASMQEMVLSVEREAAIRYGLSRQEAAGALHERTGVLPLRRRIRLPGGELPCIVTVEGGKRFSVRDLASITVRGKRSSPVPLGKLLAVQQRAAPSEIVREDQQYVRWVSFEYKGPYRHAQTFLDATIAAFPLPEGYRFDRRDVTPFSDKQKEALLLAVLAALLLVFMVTASLYESLLDPFIIMLSVPLAYIGVFVAYVWAGIPFGRGGYLSVIFLTGIAVANAIVIVDFISRKRTEGAETIEAIVEASVCRLRPVLMTTLVTAGSLVPMLLGERSSIWYSVALGTLGGSASSAVLTLLVIPTVYAIAHRYNSLPAPSRTYPLNPPLGLTPSIPLSHKAREGEG